MATSTLTALRPLGRTGLEVTGIGLGTAPLGGLFAPVSDSDADATVRRALDLGIRYVDTAPLYGHGLSEQRLGASLRRAGDDEVVMSTKVGRIIIADPHADTGIYKGIAASRAAFDFTRRGVLRSLDESLARLGRLSIDIVLIHDPDDHMDIAVHEAYPALARLRDAGAIRAVGVGTNATATALRFVRDTDVDCVLIAGRYTLLDQSAADELFPACIDRDVAVILGGVYNSGILADVRADAPFDYAPASADVLRRARRIAEVCAHHGVPLKAAALQFAGAHPAVTCMVVGARSAAEVAENLDMAATRIPAALWAELRADGLIAAGSPLPGDAT